VLGQLFLQNKAWADEKRSRDPDYFRNLSSLHAPDYLWIGCSDSRVPANQIVGLQPGEMFVHRNVSNLVLPDDLNCLSVMQYAVDVLKVKHIIVCGHYGCGGVRAALDGGTYGLIDEWLGHLREIHGRYATRLGSMRDPAKLVDKVCELNIIEQVAAACRTSIVRDAWERKQRLAVHGWIYGLSDGLLRDLNVCVTRPEEIAPSHERAIGDALSDL
jgi:carbonic anhydrase